jgi:putative ABC transport system permease protein
MWAVVGSALAARRGQTVIVALVALLAAAAVAAVPWYAVAAYQRVGVAAVAGTPVAERMITVSRRLETGEPPPADPGGEVRSQLSPTGFAPVASGVVQIGLRTSRQPLGEPVAEANLAFREDLCGHVAVAGACPAAAGEVVVPAAFAERLGVAVGDEVTAVQLEDEPHPLRVVGVYQVVDPAEPYWGSGELIGLGSGAIAARDTVFGEFAGMAEFLRVTYTYDLVAVPEAFAAADPGEILAGLAPAIDRLRTQGYAVSLTGLESVADRIARDRQNLAAGVGVAVAVLLLLTWFTLVVALREAVNKVRADVGWWRLRGGPSGRGWLYALGQSVTPLVLGAALGAVVGFAVGRGLGGAIEGAGANRNAQLLALVLTGLVVGGGLVAAVATQLGTLRTPVRDLLRRVPARQRRWRRSLVDLVLVVLAAAAVGQALAVGRAAGAGPGLALLAPGLVVLALALVAAWAVPPLVAWLADRALRAGRLGVALVAASMARRPGGHRLFALVAVAVALVTSGLAGWDTDTRSQRQRAELQAGADRVVTVEAADAAQLLAAVRAVDPDGTDAMAVVHRPRVGGQPPVLAVDSPRLAVVAGWRAEFGGSRTDVATLLRPTEPDPVEVSTGRLTVAASGLDPTGLPLQLRVRLRVLGTGEPVEAVLGPFPEAPATHTADLPGCDAGCRLVGVELLGPESTTGDGRLSPRPGAWVEISRLTDVDGQDLEPGLLADPTRWRPSLAPADLGPVMSAGETGLRLTVPELPDSDLNLDHWAFIVDSPLPLPALVSRWRPEPAEEARLVPLAGAAVPVRLLPNASLLPRSGTVGAVVDLEYAERLVPFAVGGGTAQVWLSPEAPPSIVDELRVAGLRPVREESLSGAAARLRAEGSPVGGRFQLVVALLGLLLAAGAVIALAAEERSARVAELAALRAQGVPDRVVRAASYGGLAALVGAAVLIGLIAGLIGVVIGRLLDPGFVDGWSVLPAAPLHPYPIILAVAAAVLVLGSAVLAASAGVARRVRRSAP